MGGVRVDGDTQMSNVPGLFAAGECAAGLHGANLRGGNSLSDLRVFGKRAGEHAARFARENGAGSIDEDSSHGLGGCELDPWATPAADQYLDVRQVVGQFFEATKRCGGDKLATATKSLHVVVAE